MNPPTPPAPVPADSLRQRVRGAPTTTALVVAFVLVFLATSFDPDRRILLAFAKVNARVRAGELWRLVTASFLHANVMHLWFNSMALWVIGPAIERVYGGSRYLLLFLGGGAVGMGASVLFVPQPSVGASAGVFALLGVLLAFALRFRERLDPRFRRALIRQVLFVVALNVALGLMAAFIDNAAHLGGLAGGFALAFVVEPRRDRLAPPPPDGGA